MSLVEMALGRFPIPKPSDQEIDEEMKLPPAGSIPPRPKSDDGSVKAHKCVLMFAMLVHIAEDVRNIGTWMITNHLCLTLFT